MSLYTISNPEPVVIPPVAQIEYPHKYIVKLEGLTPTGTGNPTDKQALLIGFRPYNQSTKDIYPDSSKDTFHTIDNIWEEAVRVPLFAQTLGMIVQVAALLDAERYYVGKLAEENITAEQTAIYNSGLLEVQTTLGISSV